MKILIRLPNWLGDIVMSTAFIAAVRQLYPSASIDIIVKKELSFIASLIPGINQVHSFSKTEFPGLKGVYRYGRRLGAEKYDLFFSLPDSLSSLTMGWATRTPQRVGFRKEGGFFLLTKAFKRPVNIHRAEEYISLLEQFTGKPVTEKAVSIQGAQVHSNSQVLINFNSEANSRRMPLEKARMLTDRITSKFCNTKFGFIGGPKDTGYVDAILEGSTHAERITNFTGKTSLAELAALMLDSKLLLTTDSGPAHLANSLGLPVIVMFGAGNEHNTAPYNKKDLHVIRAGKLSCEPCVRNECKLYGIPKCMELLDEKEIIDAMNVYLSYA